jgi:hypothetical protein
VTDAQGELVLAYTGTFRGKDTVAVWADTYLNNNKLDTDKEVSTTAMANWSNPNQASSLSLTP